MVELALRDKASECPHLVLDLDLLIYTGALEVVQPFRATEFGDDAVDALSEVLWTADVFMFTRGEWLKSVVVGQLKVHTMHPVRVCLAWNLPENMSQPHETPGSV